MEFSFNINNLFGGEVSKVDRNLVPFRNSPDKYREYQKQLTEVIDHIGEASARAQGLKTIITTGSKLSYSDHNLYVIKDAGANNGLGAVVGFLKVGRKRLFIYDSHGNHHESEPLCALDFYVHESKQRMGCGRKLFEFMIKNENIKAQHIAIDRPSHKFLSFLQKHYNLKATIPQVNNFVVFDGFFRDRPNGVADKRRGKPPTHPYHKRELYDRGDPQRPPSGRSTLTGKARLEQEKESLRDIPVARPGSRESGSSTASGGRPPSASRLTMGNDRAMGAQHNMYSRHTTNTTAPCPPSETHRRTQTDPPMLRRDGPSTDYLQLLNGDLTYQDRRGHLIVAPLAAAARTSNNPSNTNSSAPMVQNKSENKPPQASKAPFATVPASYTVSKRPQEPSFNVLGVPNTHPANPGPPNNRRFQQTRLW